MQRFLYHPDNVVYIDKEYIADYADFVKDCGALGLDHPIEEGKFFLYTPSGLETIEDGMHYSITDTPLPEYQVFLNKKESILKAAQSRLIQQMVDENTTTAVL